MRKGWSIYIIKGMYMTKKSKTIKPYEVTEEQLREYQEIEEYVLNYQKQFLEENKGNPVIKREADDAALKLLDKFNPLFTKYALIVRSGHFNWADHESRVFVSTFMTDKTLLKAIFYTRQSNEQRSQIYNAFNFVKETYGKTPQEEMLVDMQMCLLTMAKKYKNIGKNFCAYANSSFKYELSRHIKSVIKNPLNVKYNIVEYNNNSLEESGSDMSIEETIESYYEEESGRPSFDWYKGECSHIFNQLSEIERRILVKYYIDQWNDDQIAKAFGLHLNTINYKRHNAVKKLCDTLGYDFTNLKRSRNSGKHNTYRDDF